MKSQNGGQETGPKAAKWYHFRARFTAAWRRILDLNDTPHGIALGLALGIFVGFLPIMGIQMAVVLLVSLPFRKANKVAAVAGVWISNPLTVVPVYVFIYLIGILFYPPQTALSAEAVRGRIKDILDIESVSDQIPAFLSLGGDIFFPMVIGGVVAGLAAAVLTYLVTRKIVADYQRKKEPGV